MLRKLERFPGATPVHRKLGTVVSLTEADEAVLEAALARRERIRAGAMVIDENSPVDHAYAVLDGWSLRFRIFQDGRRQICRLFLPGDFIGLSGSLPGVPSHPVVALTVPHAGGGLVLFLAYLEASLHGPCWRW